MTYNGDTIKQVGTMNRNLWVSACNPSLSATSNAHVLLPKHKWAEAKGSKSCDIDVQSDKYTEGDHCPLTEYQCQKQEVPESVCINMLDLRNQTCVAVGGGACTKIDNLSQLNNCGFQNFVNKQNECYAKPECKDGRMLVLVLQPAHHRAAVGGRGHAASPVQVRVRGPMPQTVRLHGRLLGHVPRRRWAELRRQQVHDGQRGLLPRHRNLLDAKQAPPPNRRLRRYAQPGRGGTGQAAVHRKPRRDRQRHPRRVEPARQGNNESATRHAAVVWKGFDMAKGKCVEGFQTTQETANRCPTIFANNNACCDEEARAGCRRTSRLPFPKPTRPGYARWVP